jgi:hypothetical protein
MIELNQSGQEYKCTDIHSNEKFPVEVQFKNEYPLIKLICKLRVLQIIENKKRVIKNHPFLYS